MARMDPIPLEECTDPDLAEAMDHFTHTLGSVPDGLTAVEREPAITKANHQAESDIFNPNSQVQA